MQTERDHLKDAKTTCLVMAGFVLAVVAMLPAQEPGGDVPVIKVVGVSLACLNFLLFLVGFFFFDSAEQTKGTSRERRAPEIASRGYLCFRVALLALVLHPALTLYGLLSWPGVGAYVFVVSALALWYYLRG